MKQFLLIIIWYLVSCSVTRNEKSNNDCLANEKFKKEFFTQIEYVKKNISVSQNKKFIESLIFIANYAPVSFEEMINYGRTYTIKTLEKDEIEWLKWYQENKCKNLQLKKKYPIPEKYLIFFEK
jgi:hypothetical protein